MNRPRQYITLLFAIAVMPACMHGTHPHDMSATQHEQAAEDVERSAAAADQDRAARTHELATAHRAAGESLMKDEEEACAGLDETQRARGPFTDDAEIAEVEPRVVLEPAPFGKGTQTRERGAIVVFRARPGLTTQWIDRLARCHVAYASRVGHDAPSLTWSPLAVRDVSIVVRPTEGGFALEIATSETAASEAVLSRARALVPSPRVSSRPRG